MWFKRGVNDTQPLPIVSPDVEKAHEALEHALDSLSQAQRLNTKVRMNAQELEARCQDNHFAQGWLAVLKGDRS